MARPLETWILKELMDGIADPYWHEGSGSCADTREWIGKKLPSRIQVYHDLPENMKYLSLGELDNMDRDQGAEHFLNYLNIKRLTSHTEYLCDLVRFLTDPEENPLLSEKDVKTFNDVRKRKIAGAQYDFEQELVFPKRSKAVQVERGKVLQAVKDYIVEEVAIMPPDRELCDMVNRIAQNVEHHNRYTLIDTWQAASNVLGLHLRHAKSGKDEIEKAREALMEHFTEKYRFII